MSQELIELRKLAEAATQGKWENYETLVYLPQNLGGFDIRNAPNAHVNAAYIAAANPAAVISLLDQIQELQAENDLLKANAALLKEGWQQSVESYVSAIKERDALAAKLATLEADAELLVKEMRYIATITKGQAHRIAMMTLEKVDHGIQAKGGQQ